MEPNTWRGRNTFSKILSLPICASCMPNVLSSRRVFQHLRKVHFPTVLEMVFEMVFEMENGTR